MSPITGMSSRGRILIIEDDVVLAQSMEGALSRERYAVSRVPDGFTGLRHMARHAPDLVVLDLMLPGQDGLDVCRSIRETDQVGILIVSGRNQAVDRVRGLEAGADDYLGKPFAMQELVLRVGIILRRLPLSGRSVPPVCRLDRELWVHLSRGIIERAGEEISMTPIEGKLMLCLARNLGQVVEADVIVDAVWGPGYSTSGGRNCLRVNINQLRRKLGDLGPDHHYLLTAHRVGYQLRARTTDPFLSI